jgi:hypothetical protein
MSATRPANPADSLWRLIFILFVSPAPFEFVMGVVRRDNYDFRRLEIIGGVLVVLAILVAVFRKRYWWNVQSIVGYYVILAGLATTAFGVAATFWGNALWGAAGSTDTVKLTVSTLAPAMGVAMTLGGVLLVRDRVTRARADLETPLPATIAQARRSARHPSSAWEAPSFRDRPGQGNRRLVEIVQRQLDVKDLHLLAFFDNDGACQFYADLLDDDGLANRVRRDSRELRMSYVAHGRHVRALVGRLDRRLADLDTGRLVRVVLDVERGALFYYHLGTVGFLVGVTLIQDRVDPTDWKMSDLANEFLKEHGGRPDDDFYRYCPRCLSTNRAHDAPPAADDNVIPLQRPRNGNAS